MSIRVQRALRDLIHGPYGRWIMLGLLIVILCVFTVTQDIEDWLRSTFGEGTAATTSDVAGSFAVLPGDVSEVTHSGFESARRRIGLARAFLERSPMDRVRDTEVWSHLVLIEAAKQEQVAVSREDLREVIGRVVPDYIFNDPQEYRKWVRENFQGASAPALEAAVLEFLTAFRVRQIYRESFLVGPPATRKAAIGQAVAQNVEYAFGDYAALDASRFLAEAEDELKSEADPDMKLREFFDKDPSVKLDNERFRHPRRFKIELLYSIHANVDTDEERARIEALVKKAYPEAAFKEVNVADRKTYFGTYRDRLLKMAGKTWEGLAKEVPSPDVPAPGTPPGPDEPGAQPPEKPDEPATPPAKPDEPVAPPANPDEPVAPPAKPDEPAAQAGQSPAEPPKPAPELSPDQRQRVIDYGYVIVKDQVGREVALRSVYEFLYTQAKDNVSLKEMFDRLKASDDPLNPVCGTEPGKGLLVYRDFDGKALSGDELKEIEDSGVKFGFSFMAKVTPRTGDTDVPKMSPKADTLGDEGHGRQFFRLLEVIREQRKTFEELTPGEKEDLKRLFYLPERARERAKEKLEALRQKLADGTLKIEQFRTEAEALGCRVHEGEWIEASYKFQREPDRKQLWPSEYLHMRDRYFLRTSLRQVLERDRVKQEYKAGAFLPVDADIRRDAAEPGAAYLFRLRERKQPDATTIPPAEIATYLKHFATQKIREESARWNDDPQQLIGDFRMSFDPEMQARIDDELKRREEARRKGSDR